MNPNSIHLNTTPTDSSSSMDRQLKATMSAPPNTINNRNNVRSTSDRLSRLISTSMIQTSLAGGDSSNHDLSIVENSNQNHVCPMISLPENYQYWSEGGKSKHYNEGFSQNNDDLVISSSSLSSPVSSASSSPSPSPSNQSVNSNKLNPSTSFDFDANNEQAYRDAFIGKVRNYLLFFTSSILTLISEVHIV